MPKVTPTSAPDFTEDERKWIEQHPFWRVVFMVLRLALIPVALAAITSYFQYRSSHVDQKTEAAYKTVAPAVDATQEQVKALNAKVELLQQLVLVLAQNSGARPPVTGVAAPSDPAAGIGLGNLGTIGRGAGSSGGYGSGPGRLGAADADSTLAKLVALENAAKQRKDVVAVSCLAQLVTQARRDPGAGPKWLALAAQCGGQDAAFQPAKANLVEQLEKVHAKPFEAKPLPKSLDDALQQMAK